MEKQIQLEARNLKEIAQGNEQAFKWLVDHFSDRLGHFIASITKDYGLAQEVVQDIFLKIWQNRESLTTVMHFRRWLFVVSRHQALNALRKAIRIEYGLEDQQTTALEVQTREGLLENERRFCLLDQAVDLLPNQQRKVYLLSRREGKTYKQIAQELHISPETVKKYLQLAVAHIIKHVEASASLTFFYLFIK